MTEPLDPAAMLTTAEAAGALGVTRARVRQLIRWGQLEAVQMPSPPPGGARLGWRWMVPAYAVLARKTLRAGQLESGRGVAAGRPGVTQRRPARIARTARTARQRLIKQRLRTGKG